MPSRMMAAFPAPVGRRPAIARRRSHPPASQPLWRGLLDDRHGLGLKGVLLALFLLAVALLEVPL
jgi:hypothetical protein